jgi:hypothetical protein
MEVTSRAGYQSEVIAELEKSDPEFYGEWNNFLANVIEPYLQLERTLLVRFPPFFLLCRTIRNLI